MMAKVPDSSTQEYLWWSQGAADEAKARDAGLSPGAREAREVLEGIARRRPSADGAELVKVMARIYAPEILKRRHRAY